MAAVGGVRKRKGLAKEWWITRDVGMLLVTGLLEVQTAHCNQKVNN